MFAHTFTFDNLKNTVPLIKQVTQQQLQCLKTDGKTPINCVEICEKITSEIVLRTFFGYEDKETLQLDGKPLSLLVDQLIKDVNMF